MHGEVESFADGRELSDGQFAAIRTDHELWLKSEGKEGSPADLGRSCLRGRKSLRGARLERTDLSDADLTDADLSGADLRGARFGRAVLTGTSLFDADLREADLAATVGLVAGQLAGAVLTRATLPNAVAAFEGVKQADRIADNAQKLYLALLGACAYSVLTIATTRPPTRSS
jgi:uncharacterized protein YjbI with pentapeptide repeats